jgi:hypothetical protein
MRNGPKLTQPSTATRKPWVSWSAGSMMALGFLEETNQRLITVAPLVFSWLQQSQGLALTIGAQSLVMLLV